MNYLCSPRGYRTTTFVFGIILLCGCAHTNINAYTNPNLSPGMVESVAVMPILGTRFAPRNARELNQSLIEGLKTTNPSVTTVTDVDVVQQMSVDGFSEKWESLIRAYRSTGYLDQDLIRSLDSLLGVDAVVQLEIIDAGEQDGSRKYNSSSREWEVDRGRAYLTVGVIMLSLQDASIIWEATANTTKNSFNSPIAPNVSELFDSASKKILSSIPDM